MATKLKNLVLNEVSLVDRGANQHAHVTLFKRDADPAVDDEIAVYLKREFTAQERKDDAKRGAALPDGSFPILNAGDLKNAMRAIGRAKDPAKAKAHIRARARALGLSAQLSDAFKSVSAVVKDGALSFDDAQLAIEVREYVRDMMTALDEARCALSDSVWSIMGDDEIADKKPALDETFAQFKEHIAGLVPDEVEKVIRAAAAAIDVTKGETMTDQTSAAIKKALGLADTATEADVLKAITAIAKDEIAKRDQEIAILKLPEPHRVHAGKLSGEPLAKFIAMAPAERDAEIIKAKPAIDPEVQKRLDDAAEDRKVLKTLQDKDELATFTKRAVEIGLAEADGETLRKAHKGDKDALGKLEGVIKGLAEQVRTGKVFSEFGHSNTVDATSAAGRMDAAVAELQKADSKLGRDQAIAKIAESRDPKHQEVWKSYKAEMTPRAA